MATYIELQQQIAALQAEAERVRRDEIDGVIARIKEAIEHYGLTPADLGFGRGKRAAMPAASRRTAPGRKPARGKAVAKAPGVKYRDGAGNTWGGRGPRPRWLREALEAGHSLQDFRV